MLVLHSVSEVMAQCGEVLVQCSSVLVQCSAYSAGEVHAVQCNAGAVR